MTKSVLGAALLAFLCIGAREASAQSDVELLGLRHGVRPPPGYYELVNRDPSAFRFSSNGVWRTRAAQVSARRNQLRAAGRGDLLALEAAGFGSAAVMSGDLNVPVLLIAYSNTDTAGLNASVPSDRLRQNLFDTNFSGTYSVHTYYLELSNDLLRLNGTVGEWRTVPDNDTFYEGGCNGLCSNSELGQLIRDAVAANDAAFDYGQFDNDGSDNIPNSGDDDGFVDVLVLVHPELDGACGTTNIWAHRWNYPSAANSTGVAPTLETADDAAGGGKVKIRDYIIQGGQGGSTGCSAGQAQVMGVVSHELGHALGLPDLYDTGGSTEGIGVWGLMGAGNWHVPTRPVHMSAWSKAELGWVTEVLVDSLTQLTISPVETGDTTYVVRIENSSEYFLLSNRQPIGSDTSLVLQAANGRRLNSGLLIWHVDSTLIGQRLNSNTVNVGAIHGLALEQADGLDDLGADNNRGDDGDSYPGSTGNTRFGFNSSPNSLRNDGTFSSVTVDQINEDANGVVTALVAFGSPLTITTSHSRDVCADCAEFYAAFTVGTDTVAGEFAEFLSAGTVRTLAIDSIQLVDSGRRQFTWLSWSDGGARVHDVTATGTGDSIIGQLRAEYMIEATVVGKGTVSSPDLPNLAGGTAADMGQLTPEESTVRLVAQGGADFVFSRWTGFPTVGDTLTLGPIVRPMVIEAVFQPVVGVVAGSLDGGLLGFDYLDSLQATGGNDQYRWELVSGTVPPGLRLNSEGVVFGVPEEQGTFTFTVKVISGGQQLDVQIDFTVGAPQLAQADVLGQLLGTVTTLTTEELRFLDLNGNKNGPFDVGDFLKWIDDAGASVSPAIMRILRREEVRR